MTRLLLLTLLLAACSQQQKAPDPVPAKDYPINGWGVARDRLAYDALVLYGRDLIAAKPKDILEWCPNYTPAIAVRFYIGLASALTKFESNWKSSTTYTEDFKDAKGKPIISRGLAQISQESANSYGCGITDPKQLHDDATNLNCLARIWNRWIVRDNQIGDGIKGEGWTGAERYHSPFRKHERIESMKTTLREICE